MTSSDDRSGLRVAVLVGPEPIDADFIEDVLRLAGHEVERVDAARPGEARDPDVLMAGLVAATKLGWLAAPQERRPRKVIVSRFPRLLAPLAARPDLRLVLEPSTPAQLLAALAESVPTLPPPDGDFDWAAHDARLLERGLTGLPPDAQLAAIAGLAARSVGAPVAFVAVVDSARQRFVGEHGLPDDLRVAGGSPREWSFCQHVVASDSPLVVEDAALVPTLADSPLVRFGVVRAYAGVPVRSAGNAVGTVCVLSAQRRAFSAQEIASLELAARAAESRLDAIRVPPETMNPSDVVSADEDAGYGNEAERVDLVGSTIAGKYLVTARIGEGGMSRVYLAREQELERLVAIKVLESRVDDRALLREARQLARIRHPCIMQLFDWGRLPNGRAYLVLEYVRGDSLRDRLRALGRARRWLPRGTFLRYLRNLAGALETLHGAGLVHGDVKPGNVLMDDALDRVVLIDFGLAMNTNDAPGATIAGGTLGYSAPEQLVASTPAEARPTLDVYALGALAYSMLTYTAPFSRLAQELRLEAQREGAFVPPSRLRPDLGVAVDAVFERALAPDPSVRYETVSSLVDALERALPGGVLHRNLSTLSMQAIREVDAIKLDQPRSLGGGVARVRVAVARELGVEREQALLKSLSHADAAALEDAKAHPGRLISTLAYSAYLRAYAAGDLRRIFTLAERTAREEVPERLASLSIERTPHTVLRASESIFHRFHAWGELRLERVAADRSRVDIATPRVLAPEQCTALAGAISGTLQWVRREVRVTHYACVAQGAQACVLDVGWSSD